MWKIEYAQEAERDFELILDHLILSYEELGDDRQTAFERAADRILGIESAVQNLSKTPYIGTLRPDIRPGVRFVRQDKVVIWFLPEQDRKRIVVLALFFGAQDHIRHMLTRLLPPSGA